MSDSDGGLREWGVWMEGRGWARLTTGRIVYTDTCAVAQAQLVAFGEGRSAGTSDLEVREFGAESVADIESKPRPRNYIPTETMKFREVLD
jgi:hypothetical protein